MSSDIAGGGVSSTAAPAPPTTEFRAAVARLRHAQKPKSPTPLYLRYVNRRLGGYLAAAGLVRGATPNQLTLASATLSFAGIALLAAVPPRWWLGPAVAFLLLAGYAFDSADGQLARLRGGGSPAGEWLDHVVDAVKTCALHAAVLVHLYRSVPETPRIALLAPLVFLTASIAVAFGSMLRDQLLRGTRRATDEDSGSLLRSVALLPADHGTLSLSFVLLSWSEGFLGVYIGLAVLTVLFAARLMVRCYRALTRSD